MSSWNGRSDDASLRKAWQELAAQAAQQAAEDKPWLLKLLSQHGAALTTRYALWKERFRRLRQGDRRRLQRRLSVGLAGAALLLALNGGPTAHAGAPIVADGASCTLANAINSANTNSAVGGCTTGYAGADTIDLQTDVTLTASNNSTYGPTGLPVVASAITIKGNGHTISRTSGTFRIMAVGSGGDLTLNSATVSGGVATGSGNERYGSGIFTFSSSLTVSNSTLSGNSADYGGGIYAGAATLSVSNSTLSGNSATFGGGGIHARTTTVAVSYSTLSGNSATMFGGGIRTESSTVTVSYSTLSGNSATVGGGIFGRYSTVAVSNSTLSSNSAGLSGGGGIVAISSSLAVSNSTLSSNSADLSGGGVFALFATVTVSNSTLSDNSASSDGGGILANFATVAVSNSTLSGNSAGRGGGVWAYQTTVTLQRSLVSGNSAPSDGNEVYNYASTSTITAANYNLFGHDGETNAQAFSGFTPGATDINATSDGTTPTALAAILTTPLADNDSTVLAGAPPGAAVQTLALPTGSPAIDKAPSADCLAAPTDGLDQRGRARNADGNAGASANECDIGAFEVAAEAPPANIPRIVIQKQTRPDGDATPFQFKLNGPANRSFTLSDNGVKSTGLIPAGIYTLEEVLPPGWDPAIPFAQMTCDDGSPLSAIDLAADEVLVCRFLNYKRGNIVVKKVTIPPVAAPGFAMQLINDSTQKKTLFSLANTQQFDTGAISSVPTYKLLETVPGGWKKKSIVCNNGSLATAIVVPPGGTVTCTVTNENSAPGGIQLSSNSLKENQPVGTMIGTLSAGDSVAGDTHTFTFVDDGSAGASGNSKFQIAGKQLKSAAVFDYETKTSYNIKLKVTDSAGQTYTKNFVIQIVNGPN